MKEFYDALCDWLQIHPISTGGCLAIILTGLRVAMAEGNKSFGMVCLEGLSCGLLSMAFSYAAVNMFGVDNSVGILIGASAGFVGIDRLKAIFIRLIDTYLANRGGSHVDE